MPDIFKCHGGREPCLATRQSKQLEVTKLMKAKGQSHEFFLLARETNIHSVPLLPFHLLCCSHFNKTKNRISGLELRKHLDPALTKRFRHFQLLKLIDEFMLIYWYWRNSNCSCLLLRVGKNVAPTLFAANTCTCSCTRARVESCCKHQSTSGLSVLL